MGVARRHDDSTPTALADRKLPGLVAGLDAAVMAPRLRPLLGAQGALSVRLLKHVPGKRAVLLYRFEDGNRAVGKMVRKDRAARSQAVLTALHAALPPRTRTPRPLACWEDLGLLVLEHMPGAPLAPWSDLARQEQAVERMADSLADLHGLRLGVGAPATLADHVRRTCHPGLAALRQALPHLGALLQQVEHDMFLSEARRPVQLVPSHGDFGPGQILVQDDALALLDLDGFSHSDAGLDVANVLVGLEVHAGLEARDLARRFRARYQAQRGLARIPGLPHYRALACLRRAMILLRRRPSGWEEQVLVLAGRARQSLRSAREANDTESV